MRPWLLAIVVVTAACGPEEPATVSGEREAIVGGAEESGSFLVAMVGALTGERQVSPFCTATAITPTVVITAAHCLDTALGLGDYPTVVVFVPEDGSENLILEVDLEGAIAHPDYVPGRAPDPSDIALFPLVEPLEVMVFPELRREALLTSELGLEVTVVGFGATHAGGALGTKRSIEMALAELPLETPEFFVIAVPDEPALGTCNGDSGAPGFTHGLYRDVQIGVHARAHLFADGAWQCGTGEQTSVPHFFEAFLRPTALSLDPEGELCGDGVCTGLERREDCPGDCDLSECGDSIVDEVAAEICDDGDTRGGDGCSADCRSDESCGNGILDVAAGEICDDGNTLDGDGCSADCRSDESCGNGVIDVSVGELCDDGNELDDDQCPSRCGRPVDDGEGGGGGCSCHAAGDGRWPGAGGALRLLP